MRLDLEFNIKFIQMVKERPCLYDTGRSDYNNRRLHDTTWQEIATRLNVSVKDCKDKWRHLRGCYTRHLKNKTNYSKYIKPYYLAEFLSFLDDFTKARPSYDVLEMDEHFLEVEQGSASEAGDEEEIERLEEFESPSPTVKIEKKSRKDYNKITRPKRVFIEDTDVKPVEYGKLPKLNDLQDPDVAFLYSLLPDLKDMRADQKRRFRIGAIKLICNIMGEDTLAPNTMVNDDD